MLLILLLIAVGLIGCESSVDSEDEIFDDDDSHDNLWWIEIFVATGTSRIAEESSYDIYLSGPSNWTEIDGIYTSGVYTSGSKYSSFIISSTVAIVT